MCDCFTSRVGPLNLTNDPKNNILTQIKDSTRSIHSIHLNKNAANKVIIDQPKDTNNFNKFHDQFESELFTRQKSESNGFHLLDGFENLGYSIIFRNKIKFFESNNKNLSNNLPLLFFIHGVGGNAKVWTNQLEFFSSQGYEIISIDLLGHGQSSFSNEKSHYEFLNMAFDTLFIYDLFCKTNNNNVIIGHSYGCSFATYLAQNRNESISKLILISGGSPHPLDFQNPLLSFPLCFIKCLKPCLKCHFLCAAFSSYCNQAELHSNEAFNISSKSLMYTMKGQVWLQANEHYHKQLKQPVLLIEGEHDKLVPLDDALDMISIIDYGYLVILKNGSHMIIIEQPETINKLILLFLNESFLNKEKNT